MDICKRKTLLVLSVMTSLLLHGAALVSLRHYSFAFASFPQPLLEPLEKMDEILEEAFQKFAWGEEMVEPHSESHALQTAQIALPSPIPFHHAHLLPTHQTEHATLPFAPKMHHELFHRFLSQKVPLQAAESLSERPPLRLPPQPELASFPLHATLAVSTPQVARSEKGISKAIPSPGKAMQKISWDRTGPAADVGLAVPHLPYLPSLRELQTISCSEAFDLDLVFTPLEGEEGILFALTLIPCEELPLPKMRQNYLFLIDRSNSIQKERLVSTQQAVARALEDLAPEDTFNIFVFDSRIEKFSSYPQSVTPTTLGEAKKFLDQIQLGSFFSQADLSLPLFLSIPYEVQDDELYTAILFTNGENLKKRDRGVSLVRDWIWQNQGRVALYTVSMSSDTSLGTLNAMSALSRGQLISYSGKRALKRKMLKLMKSIHTPVAKQLSYCGVSLVKENSITLFPQKENAPIFYLDQPYVILGRARSLDDFVLFVQGRCKGQWVNIRKQVSFLSAKRAGSSLKSEWALHSAHEGYATYLRSGHLEDLQHAHELLAPYRFPTAFEAQ